MTEAEAYEALTFLAGGCGGFNDEAVEVFLEQFMKYDDAKAMAEVCERVAVSWVPVDHGGALRPSIGEVLDEYRRHPRIAGERQAKVDAALARDDRSTGPIVSAAEGRQIATDEYRRLYGREMGADPTPNADFAEAVIKGFDNFDEHNEVWLAHFVDIAKAFGGDFDRASVSLDALGPRVVRDNAGRVVLKPPRDMPGGAVQPRNPFPVPASAVEVPEPSERPLAATALLSEALGETQRRLEDR